MNTKINEIINLSNKKLLRNLENNLLLQFINSNFSREDKLIIENQIKFIFNNLIFYQCYILKLNSNQFSISGLAYDITLYDFNFLIPNIFRKCYVLDRLLIPNICIKYLKENNIYQFYPKLLDEDIIKSFLYFAVPVNIKFIDNYYSNIYSIVNIDKSILEIKKKNTTYGSYTTATEIYNMVYGINTLLSNLIMVKNYIVKSYNDNIISIIDDSYNIRWEFTRGCINNDLYVKNTYINGNVDFDYRLSSSTAYNIYKTNNFLNQFINNERSVKLSLVDDYLTNNLNVLLSISFEVYQDIITQIQYNMNGLDYCKKSYMNKSNIPLLLELYKNFYKNQIESNKKEVPVLTIRDVEPVNNSIYIYANQFRINYLKVYTQLYFLKTIYLNSTQAITSFTNVSNWKEDVPNTNIVEIIIYPYFLDTSQPNPNQLVNYHTTIETYTNVDTFVNYFNTEFKKKYKDITSIFLNSYNNGGFFPEGGTISNSQNIGYDYAYFQNDVLIYKIYLTIESYSPYNPPDSNGQGTALIYYK